jgi:hypothetical protein
VKPMVSAFDPWRDGELYRREFLLGAFSDEER